MKKNKILSLFLALMMICAVLPGCGDGSGSGTEGSNGLQAERKANNEIVAAIAEDLKSLDPHSSTTAGTREVLFNIYEGLFKTGPDGELIPAVAEKYTTSADGLTYTFTLRDGVRFHNGNAVTAEDVMAIIGGDVPPEPEPQRIYAPLPPVAEESAAWKPKKLPWWRKAAAGSAVTAWSF